jgi:hypothetical protein
VVSGGVLLRQLVEREPNGCQEQSHGAGPDECRLPAEIERENRDDGWRGQGGHVGAGIDPAERKGALALGEPFGTDFGGGRIRG